MKYHFYYDESEHSRVISLQTLKSETYYDNFLAAIVGWSNENEKKFALKYLEFEKKYADRKKKGELKSETFKPKEFLNGFASLNKSNVQMMNDFFSIFDNDVYIYLSVTSKIEYVIMQLFRNYQNSLLLDMDALKYSIVKAIRTYWPQEVIDSIYDTPDTLISALVNFFEKRIETNKKNLKLKSIENETFENILLVLKDVKTSETLSWDYHIPFIGFKNFLLSKSIDDYSLTIDKEGKPGTDSNTLVAAQKIGLKDCRELDSKEHFGIRIADMLIGVIGKLMKSLYCALHQEENNINVTKSLLDKKWFDLTESQLGLYKKLYHIIYEINNDWFKVYSGDYSDDLICLLGLLEYMNQFDKTEEIKKNFDMHPEYCNSCICMRLNTHFQQMRSKLPVEPISTKDKSFFCNKQEAKVFCDISKQPSLRLLEGKNEYCVLSVGIFLNGIPCITIKSEPENTCYVLPEQLSEWAVSLVRMANAGVKLFPSNVVFTKTGDKYYADIL